MKVVKLLHLLFMVGFYFSLLNLKAQSNQNLLVSLAVCPDCNDTLCVDIIDPSMGLVSVNISDLYINPFHQINSVPRTTSHGFVAMVQGNNGQSLQVYAIEDNLSPGPYLIFNNLGPHGAFHYVPFRVSSTQIQYSYTVDFKLQFFTQGATSFKVTLMVSPFNSLPPFNSMTGLNSPDRYNTYGQLVLEPILCTSTGAGRFANNNSQKSNGNLEIVPNPVIDNFQIKIESDFTTPNSISIFTLDGKQIWNKENLNDSNSSIKIENLNLPKGVYYIKLKNQHNRIIKKFIKI